MPDNAENCNQTSGVGVMDFWEPSDSVVQDAHLGAHPSTCELSPHPVSTVLLK